MYEATHLLEVNRWAVTHPEYGVIVGYWDRQEVAEDLAAALNEPRIALGEKCSESSVSQPA